MPGDADPSFWRMITVAMRDLPSGTVTFLFTDIEGSTRLSQELGDVYAEVLCEHRRTLREAFARHAGVEVDTQGDAFFVVFGRAKDALAAARDSQLALADGPIRVRIGVHTGEPLLTEEGYVGIDVHRAARIAAAGHGGQVLLSQSTRDLVGAQGLQDLGEHRLKDLTAPERIYQLGDGEFPPLKSLNQTNLPVQPTPLVGRKRELEEVRELLQSHRLVTLTGAGGSGKTRLALQAAAELVEEFEDGVWFVSLAALTDPELVLPTVASAIGAKGDVGVFLRSKRLLLVLDNLEQLLPGVARTVAELVTAPHVQVLSTSRERLAVAAEQEYPVPTLALAEATALFTARARQRVRDFRPDEHVGEICRRLDGLPLAVELAAARVKVLLPAQILVRLGHSLDLLTAGSRDAPQRQRTLRAAIEWSFGLLDERERELFARLAVFGSSFPLEFAEQVAGANVQTLDSLVDKSLLRCTGEGRFLYLATIREFAVERLDASAQADDVRARHADVFAALALRNAERITNDDAASRAAVFEEFHPALDDLRAALSLKLDSPWTDETGRFALALARYLVQRGEFNEARQWLEALLERERTPELRGPALTLRGLVLNELGDLDGARATLLKARALAERAGMEPRAAIVVLNLGYLESRAGNYPEAVALLDEAAMRFDALDDPVAAGEARDLLGAVLAESGLSDRARELVDESVAFADTCATPLVASMKYANSAVTLLTLGEAERAGELARRALRELHEVSEPLPLLTALEVLANIAFRQRRHARAARLEGILEGLLEETGRSRAPALAVQAQLADEEVATRAALGDRAYAEARAAGRALSREEGIAYAVADVDS
jgi:predicted ATPase/class 3 adenylate cyclase